MLACSIFASVAVGCSNNSPDEARCTAHAAFELSLSALNAPLPPDTLLRVKYSGGTEEYRLGDPVHPQETVLCDQDIADAGSDAGTEVVALHCALWTQGAATVTATGTGYQNKVKELEAQADSNKCIITVPVDLVFGDEDGGM